MKKKKITGLASFVLAACLLLTSCSGGNTGSSANSQAPANSEVPASSEAGEAGNTKSASSGFKTIKAADPSAMPAAASARKDTLVVGVNKLSGVFSYPYYAKNDDDWKVGVPISGVTFLNNDDSGKLIDGIASMSTSDDGLTYTFRLKYDDKYSDGSPVKAEDYVNFYKVLADKSYDGPSDNPMSYGLVGAQDYHDGKTDDISGIKVLDDKTLQFTIEKPNASAEYYFASTQPISTELYGKYIKHGDLSKYKSLSMINYVSDAPYIMTEYKDGQSATLKANPNYYEGEPKIKTIIVKAVPAGEEMQAVTTGDVDIEDNVTCNDDQIAIGQGAKFVNMWIQPTLGYGWVGLNEKNELFKDKKVRQALLYALDRKSLVQSVYGDYAKVLNINQSTLNWLYTEDGINTYDYDMDKAASMLKEAGWEKDSSGKLMKDGKQFKYVFSAMKGNAVTDVMIPMMIASYKKLGIDVQAEYVDWPTLSNKFEKENYDMAFMAWGLATDPNDSYVYSTSGSENYLNYSNPELDEAYKTALATVDEAKRKEQYKKVYQIINEDVPNFIIYQRSDLIAYNGRIKDFKCSPYRHIETLYQEYELQ